jgi:hypothetical protein
MQCSVECLWFWRQWEECRGRVDEQREQGSMVHALWVQHGARRQRVQSFTIHHQGEGASWKAEAELAGGGGDQRQS